LALIWLFLLIKKSFEEDLSNRIEIVANVGVIETERPNILANGEDDRSIMVEANPFSKGK
jgi:hypothetical protein